MPRALPPGKIRHSSPIAGFRCSCDFAKDLIIPSLATYHNALVRVRVNWGWVF